MSGARGAVLSTTAARVSGHFNYARRVNGVSLALVNVAERVYGVQLGLVNVAREVNGTAVGLVSLTRNGRVQPLIYTSTETSSRRCGAFVAAPLRLLKQWSLERGGMPLD